MRARFAGGYIDRRVIPDWPEPPGENVWAERSPGGKIVTYLPDAEAQPRPPIARAASIGTALWRKPLATRCTSSWRGFDADGLGWSDWPRLASLRRGRSTSCGVGVSGPETGRRPSGSHARPAPKVRTA